jgi:hypothetical protein
LDLFVNRISNLSPLIGQLVLLQKLDLYPWIASTSFLR